MQNIYKIKTTKQGMFGSLAFMPVLLSCFLPSPIGKHIFSLVCSS